jgi:hypothetical protein
MGELITSELMWSYYGMIFNMFAVGFFFFAIYVILRKDESKL